MLARGPTVGQRDAPSRTGGTRGRRAALLGSPSMRVSWNWPCRADSLSVQHIRTRRARPRDCAVGAAAHAFPLRHRPTCSHGKPGASDIML